MAQLVNEDHKAEPDGDQADAQHSLDAEPTEQHHHSHGQERQQHGLVQTPGIAGGILIVGRIGIAAARAMRIGRGYRVV
jgi:hypothetical protein